MRLINNDKKFYKLTRAILAILVCQALFISLTPFLAFNAQTGGYSGEPSQYHTNSEMASELQVIKGNHTSIVRLYNLTTTFEGRTLWAVKISDGFVTEAEDYNDPEEPDVLFIGGQKANSFISVEMAIYLINHLTDKYGEDDHVTDLVNNREIWIIPMLNPDGHVYVEEGNEDWEKNRRDNGGGNFGVNLDRNYEYMWGGAGSSGDPSDVSYRGSEPFSEKETQALRTLVENQDFVFSLTFESFGETITYPWGHTSTPSPDENLLLEIASDMAMYTEYDVIQSGDVEITHGNLNDWLHNKTDVLPFTVFAGTENIPDEENIEEIAEKNIPSCLYLIDISDNPLRAKKAEWTFLVYMSADNDLEGDGIRDINEMELVGSNPYLNIIVQCDRAVGGNDSNGDWTNTSRFLIMKDDDVDIINSPVIEYLGEMNMADPQTLRDFVNWGFTNFPAERYFLDIWGHGQGWQGVSKDKSDWLEMNEIKSVLPNFLERIDVVGFDNCNMAMIEVYTQFLGYTDYIVGSEKEEDAWGWPYDWIFSEIVSNPQISPVNLSTFIAESYVEWSVNLSYYSATASVVDMSYLSEVINRTDELARDINWTFALYSDEIVWAISETERYGKPPNPNDLYHFLELIEERVPNKPIQIKAENAIKAIETMVVAERHLTKESDMSVENAHGIAVWLYQGGSASDFADYQTLDFAKLTHWDEFLAKTKNPPPKPYALFPLDYTLSDSDNDENMDTIDLEYSTNITGLNVTVGVYSSDNEHIITFNTPNTLQGENYHCSFNPYDYDYPSDYYNFYAYIVNDTNMPQNYSQVVDVWLGNEKPDVYLKNITFYRKDGVLVGGNTGKRPIDGENTVIKADIANNGDTPLLNVKIEFFEGEILIATDQLDLNLGEEKSVSTSWLARVGEREIKVVADGDNNIKEVNESNNEIIEIVDVKSITPTNPLIIRGKVYNRDDINIIGAKVQIKNLRTNATINKTTSEKGYKAELPPDWYLEGDRIDVKASYASAKDNITIIAYSEDGEVWVNITLDTEVYDALYYFKLALIVFEIIGFILVIKYYIGMKRQKGGV
ncbi:MAG: hypothetical protein JSW00_00810 [Thermoplasmata archaeon]|nr:MAG: hypothetical protein JSW00_00810 [Thermoplasmata archaeon]